MRPAAGSASTTESEKCLRLLCTLLLCSLQSSPAAAGPNPTSVAKYLPQDRPRLRSHLQPCLSMATRLSSAMKNRPRHLGSFQQHLSQKHPTLVAYTANPAHPGFESDQPHASLGLRRQYQRSHAFLFRLWRCAPQTLRRSAPQRVDGALGAALESIAHVSMLISRLRHSPLTRFRGA